MTHRKHAAALLTAVLLLALTACGRQTAAASDPAQTPAAPAVETPVIAATAATPTPAAGKDAGSDGWKAKFERSLLEDYGVTPDHYEDLGNGFNALIPFAKAAAALTLVEPIESIGTPKPSVNHMPMLLPVLDASFIIGNVIYIDTFGNIITNITRNEFDRVAKGRRYEILIQSNRYKVKTISSSYSAVEDGEFVAIFNSAGHLEVAQNKGRIASILNLDMSSSVRINFFNQ